MSVRVGLGLSCALALGGCDFAPDYQRPSVALPSQFSDASGAQAFPPSGEWWRVFHDRELDRLESEVDAANPDLKAAFANYEAAKAHAAAAFAGLFPEIDGGLGLSANKQSANRPLRSATQPTYYGNNQLYGEVASYELDVWSRVADIVKAAEADAVATGYAFEDARLELHAELARDYVDLRGFDAKPSCSPTRSRSTAPRST